LLRIDGVPMLNQKLLDKVRPVERYVIAHTPRADIRALGRRDEQVALLLGAFVAEGWVNDIRAGFANCDREFFDSVVMAYDEVVGGPRGVRDEIIRSGSVLHRLDIQNVVALPSSCLACLSGQ